jgi:hypothetical protein
MSAHKMLCKKSYNIAMVSVLEAGKYYNVVDSEGDRFAFYKWKVITKHTGIRTEYLNDKEFYKYFFTKEEERVIKTILN